MNYNDGKWHGWNGGERPVHPETVVECLWDDGSGAGNHPIASEMSWDRTAPVAFRVIKEHKEPREFWLISGQAFSTIERAIEFSKNATGKIIHVREVIE